MQRTHDDSNRGFHGFRDAETDEGQRILSQQVSCADVAHDEQA